MAADETMMGDVWAADETMMGDVWVLLQRISREFIVPLHHEEAKTFEPFASQ